MYLNNKYKESIQTWAAVFVLLELIKNRKGIHTLSVAKMDIINTNARYLVSTLIKDGYLKASPWEREVHARVIYLDKDPKELINPEGPFYFNNREVGKRAIKKWDTLVEKYRNKAKMAGIYRHLVNANKVEKERLGNLDLSAQKYKVTWTRDFRGYSKYISLSKEEKDSMLDFERVEVDMKNAFVAIGAQISVKDRADILEFMGTRYFRTIFSNRHDNVELPWKTSKNKLKGLLIAFKERKFKMHYDENFDEELIKEKGIEIFACKKKYLSWFNKPKFMVDNCKEDCLFRAFLLEEYPIFLESHERNQKNYGNAYFYFYSTAIESYIMHWLVSPALFKQLSVGINKWHVVHDGIDCRSRDAQTIKTIANQVCNARLNIKPFVIKNTIRDKFNAYLDLQKLAQANLN